MAVNAVQAARVNQLLRVMGFVMNYLKLTRVIFVAADDD
jgi:hypothetical protein